MDSWLTDRTVSPAVKVPAPTGEPPRPLRKPLLPNAGSNLAEIVYWARYRSFWFGAISRVMAINGIVGSLLWAIDQGTGQHSPTLLAIRSNLPLTLFVAALIALAYAVGRLGLKLDPEEPPANPAALVLVVLVIVAVTSIAGPVYVAIGEAALLVLLLLVLRLRKWEGNAYLVLKAVLIASAIILLGGIGTGIGSGQLLETRVSLQAADGLLRLIVFLLGLSLYFIEERRNWREMPPTPMVVEHLQRACKDNDFGAISRWLSEGLTFSQADQRALAEAIMPRRLIVDGDVAVLPSLSGELLLFRVRKGQVVEIRVFGAGG
jgi:hypothetical protein